MEKKQQVRAIFQVGAWLAFIMLGYLGIRSYKLSVEKLKTNKCIEEIETLSRGIQFYFQGQRDYGEFNYKQAVSFKLIPKDMFKEGFTEATNAYMGGVDFFYSSLTPGDKNKAFEISFQGLSRYACVELVRMNWGSSDMSNLIAVAGYAAPTPSGVLDEIYPDTQQKDIKSRNIFMANEAPYVSLDKLESVCGCDGDNCSVVWKFR
ncbi:MAG: type 4 pilus major pilin [Alphaproteobacteria bacterium]|jgi:hypothetical protein|nr:hypothetical protein [Acetobacter sp.]OLA64613.1 MAG: hypothetical protein BHW56_06635 [Acetobacter sp. 46_36]CDA18271.1 unknown [Acetobacter sp. CAG:267]